MPGRAQVRAALKDMKTGTTRDLAARFDLSTYQRHLLSVMLASVSKQASSSWCERWTHTFGDRREIVWRYVDPLEQAGITPETPAVSTAVPVSVPVSSPVMEKVFPDVPMNAVGFALTKLMEAVTTAVTAEVMRQLEPRLAGLGQQIVAELTAAFGGAAASAEPVKTDIQADLQKTRDWVANHPQERPEPEPPKRVLPRVLVYRLDATQAKRLPAYAGSLRLEVHTDRDSGPGAARQLAERGWDYVLLNSELIGHAEQDAFMSSRCNVTFLDRSAKLPGLINKLDIIAGAQPGGDPMIAAAFKAVPYSSPDE